MVSHGTRSRYNSGCRCDSCTEANRLYARSRTGGVSMGEYLSRVGVEHGYSGYRKRGCRCDVCRAAYTDVQGRSHRKWRSQFTEGHRPIPGHVHGSLNGYNNYGCRCTDCTATDSACRDYRANK